MHALINFIRDLFRPRSMEYYALIEEIVVPVGYNWISEDKWKRKLRYYEETGKFESPILVDEHWNLVDGYSSYKIARKKGLTWVPVYIVSRKGGR